MVDLVKVRKKAKEQEARQEEAAAASLLVAQPATPQREGASTAEATVAAPAPPDAVTAPAMSPAVPAATLAAAEADGLSKLERFKKLAGKRREGLAHEVGLTDDSTRIEVLTFAISGEQYAAGIEHVVEIIPVREATRVPNADSAIRGIISLRGTIVTIMDARARLGHLPAAPGPDSRIIVVERGSETLGFEVDRVLRVVKVEASEIEPQPVVHASEQREPIRGVFRQAAALTILLDLDKLLA